VHPAPPSEDPKVADDRKNHKKRAFVRRDGFIKIRGHVSEEKLLPYLVGVVDRSVRFAHNTIDRRTGSTPEVGGLYFLDEDWSFCPPIQDGNKLRADGVHDAGPKRDLYVDVSEGSLGDIGRLFSALGEIGYGRDDNLGRGRWTVESVEEDVELAAGPNGRLLSLSHGSAESAMDDLRCRLVTHYGKAGPGITVNDGISPFKKPLLLVEPGATFKGVVGTRYGTLIRGVHADRPEIVHNAFHVVISFAEAALP
jgi:CRISPR-associated protein Csm4